MNYFASDNPTPPTFEECEVVADWCEFSGETVAEVSEKAAHFQELNQKEFIELADRFYELSDTYIYDILTGNAAVMGRCNLINRFIPDGIKRIVEHPGTKFADFGGGVGVMCEIVKRASNKEVTYIDIASKMTDFALWRFKKHELDIKTVVIPEEGFTLPEQYDIIFTDAVWEHLPPQKQIDYLTLLTQYITDDGLFYFLVDISGTTAAMPMHFPVDITALHSHLKRLGFVNVFGEHSFASVWQKSNTLQFTTFDDDL